MKKPKFTIRDLVQVVPWKEVAIAHKFLYPRDKNNYKPVFERIRDKSPELEHTDKREVLEVNYNGYVPDPWKKYATREEQLIEMLEDGYYSITTNKFSLSFRPWDQVANIPIAEETLLHYSLAQIVAHFLWEITFYGKEDDMKSAGIELEKSYTEIKKQIEEKKEKNEKKLKTKK